MKKKYMRFAESRDPKEKQDSEPGIDETAVEDTGADAGAEEEEGSDDDD